VEDDRPLTAEAFANRIEGKRRVAAATVDDRMACHEAWMAAGYAVEFALKALIMRRERLNGWPSKEARPELYTHNLRILFREAGLQTGSVPPELRGAVRTVLDWDRAHEYTSGRMSRANARSMVRAAFDRGGVVAWLQNL
jgi:hypothetical protein